VQAPIGNLRIMVANASAVASTSDRAKDFAMASSGDAARKPRLWPATMPGRIAIAIPLKTIRQIVSRIFKGQPLSAAQLTPTTNRRRARANAGGVHTFFTNRGGSIQWQRLRLMLVADSEGSKHLSWDL